MWTPILQIYDISSQNAYKIPTESPLLKTASNMAFPRDTPFYSNFGSRTGNSVCSPKRICAIFKLGPGVQPKWALVSLIWPFWGLAPGSGQNGPQDA